MKTAALIANGQIDDLEALRPAILKHKRIVAVDGGLHYCKELGIEPHLIVGDFDSCSEELLSLYRSVPKISLAQDKDETDLEVAIEHEFKEGAQEVALFGAWGNRIDHSLTNALFLARHVRKLRLETETEILFAVEKHAEIRCKKGGTISLIPLYGPVSGITTSGLKWELKKGKLDQNFIGISNVCLKDTVNISIDQGTLLCCILKKSS